MLFETKNNTIRITDIVPFEDIPNIFKCQCSMKIIAKDKITGETIDFVYLLERTSKQTLLVSTNKKGSSPFEVTYNDCFIMLGELYRQGIVEVVISKNLYNSKKPLFDIFDKLRPDVLKALTSIDYNNGMFVVKLLNNNSKVETMYYWPDTKFMYIFKEDTPIFEESGTIDIESILC